MHLFCADFDQKLKEVILVHHYNLLTILNYMLVPSLLKINNSAAGIQTPPDLSRSGGVWIPAALLLIFSDWEQANNSKMVNCGGHDSSADSLK